ncbi:hypothetical protein KVV02_003139 [Mortierella alpina]|uniref:Crinkler effector protein N-terminal domain-containing protein n=1 Tax=Mortierella alpina TaxID=64518 RepID=A0A9P7ZXL8_MORAP|nr:hypothetical protein KVV02_003139 [Mortierella alpina]
MPKIILSISKNKGKGKNGASTSHSMAAGTSSRPVADITLHCVFDGESSSKSFKVSLPLTADVGDLKDAIKDKNSPEFDFKAAYRLLLWKVLIPLPQVHNDTASHVCLDEILKKEKKLLERPSRKISSVFGIHPDDSSIHVVVQRPPPGIAFLIPGNETTKKMKMSLLPREVVLIRYDKRAIAAVGLSGKAVVSGRQNLSRLNNNEKVAHLAEIGDVGETETFDSLSSTASLLRITSANIEALDKNSAPNITIFPVIETADLYVRQAYKDLYNIIHGRIQGDDYQDPEILSRIIVARTSGISKSAFLVHFAVRLLAECADDKPPILIFHTKRSNKQPQNPTLDRAKTIISASPKTLKAEINYKDIDKKLGGVPRYVLEKPWSVLKYMPRDSIDNDREKLTKVAKKSAIQRVDEALDSVKDPMVLLQYFAQGREALEFSNRLLHRWPSNEDHDEYRLEWALASIRDRLLIN